MSDNHASLRSVLDAAIAQAAQGKGLRRHASGEPFEQQKICQLNRFIGSPDGAIFQACKKAIESSRLPPVQAEAELLGAINYLAAAIILVREAGARQAPEKGPVQPITIQPDVAKAREQAQIDAAERIQPWIRP